jgi:hypothetical protein
MHRTVREPSRPAEAGVAKQVAFADDLGEDQEVPATAGLQTGATRDVVIRDRGSVLGVSTGAEVAHLLAFAPQHGRRLLAQFGELWFTASTSFFDQLTDEISISPLGSM